MWVYKRTEPGLWTVGFYDPQGKWHTDNDYGDPESAATRVHWLNGGQAEEVISEKLAEELAEIALITSDDY